MDIVKKIPRYLRYGILTGVLVGTSYIPFPPWALLFCLSPLWFFWASTNSLKDIWWSGWIAQFVLTLIGFHWIAHTVVEFGHLPYPVGLAALLLYAAFSNLYFPLAGVAAHYLFRSKNKGIGYFLFLAGMTALLERLYPSIFPWNMGYPWFWAKLPIAQNAEWIGFYGLSLMTMTCCALVARTFQIRSHTPKLIAVSIFLTLLTTGWWLQNRLPETDRTLKVLMVQANIGNFEKYAAERHIDFRLPIITKHLELTNLGLAQNTGTELIFWPETAFPSNLHAIQRDSYYPTMLRNYIAQKKIPLVTGGYLDEPNGQYFNSLFYLNEQGDVTSQYSKHMLLAFGEYFPGANIFPFLKKLVPAVSDFGRGNGPGILKHGSINLGAQICYEGLFDHYTRELAHLKSDIIINVTNDSWFGHLFESRQHLYMTLARAIELRKPLVRVTNTGISAAVSAAGNLLIESPEEVEWFGQVQIPFYSNGPKTFYSGFGYWLSWLLAGFVCLLGLILPEKVK